MKVLLQFRFVGDTAKKKKKKKEAYLEEEERLAREGGAVVAIVFVQQKFTVSYAPRKWGVYLE